MPIDFRRCKKHGFTHFNVTVECAECASEKVEAAPSASNNSDYAKCADDILKLDLADAIIDKHGCLVTILKRHFA